MDVSRDCPIFFEYPLLSQERVKLRTSNFTCTFIGSIGTKAHLSFSKSSRGRCQGLPTIFRAPIHKAHLAVTFAIAQLCCNDWCIQSIQYCRTAACKQYFNVNLVGLWTLFVLYYCVRYSATLLRTGTTVVCLT